MSCRHNHSSYIICLRCFDRGAALLSRRAVKVVRRPAPLLVLALSFMLIFGEFLLAWINPVSMIHKANAAYTGKRLRTVEYTLGGSSDVTARTTGTITYAGNSWNTVAATAGTRSLVLSGSNIRVVHAYLDTTAQPTTATNATDEAIGLKVASSSNPNDFVRLAQISGTFWAQSGGTEYLHFVHDATALFDRQTDVDWANGVPVTGMFAVTGPTTIFRTMKLIVTYEYDYDPSPHTEVKTIRFPLTSTTTNDVGTISTCAVSTTCTFVSTSTMPDLLGSSTANILDVYYELSVQIDSGTASTFSPKIRGGSAGPSFNWTDILAGDTNIRAIFHPNTGGSDFLSNSTQYLDVTMGTVAGRLITGELVVTYKADTASTRQMETVSYYLNQYTAAMPATKQVFATTTVTISNAARQATNVWYRVDERATSTASIVVNGRVGTSSTERTATYSHTATNARDGMTPRLILDLSQDAGQIWNSTTTLAGAVTFAGGPPPAIEAMITFEWDGTQGGTETKSVQFGAPMPAVSTTANGWMNQPVQVVLPETVTKTYRDAYVRTTVHHSQATSITAGNVILGANGTGTPNGVTVVEGADTTSEAFAADYLLRISSSTFSNGDTISWTAKKIELSQTLSAANTQAFTNVMTVTYDADFPRPPLFGQLHYRWMLDDASEANASLFSTEDSAPSADLYVGDPVRLRLLLQNSGGASTTRFQLEYSSTSCSTWYPVSATPTWQEWGLRLTQYVPDLASTTNRTALTDPALSFTPGYVISSTNPAPALDLGDSTFTEYEWSVRSTASAAILATYCFRATNNGSLFKFEYLTTPAIMLSPASRKPIGGGAGSVEESGAANQTSGGTGQTGGGTTEGSGTTTVQSGGNSGGGSGDSG